MVLLRNSFFDVRFVVGLLHSSLLGPELGHARVLKKKPEFNLLAQKVDRGAQNRESLEGSPFP